jgi:hypothetical protein
MERPRAEIIRRTAICMKCSLLREPTRPRSAQTTKIESSDEAHASLGLESQCWEALARHRHQRRELNACEMQLIQKSLPSEELMTSTKKITPSTPLAQAGEVSTQV